MQEKDSTSICSVAASAMLANPGGPQNHASSRQAGGSTTPFKILLGAAEMAMPGPELPRSGPEAGPSAVQPVTLGLKPFVRQFNHPKCPTVDTKKQAAHTTKLCAQVSAIASLHGIEKTPLPSFIKLRPWWVGAQMQWLQVIIGMQKKSDCTRMFQSLQYGSWIFGWVVMTLSCGAQTEGSTGDKYSQTCRQNDQSYYPSWMVDTINQSNIDIYAWWKWREE